MRGEGFVAMFDSKVSPGRVGQAQPFGAGEQVHKVVRAQPVPETGACTSGGRWGLRQRKARGAGRLRAGLQVAARGVDFSGLQDAPSAATEKAPRHRAGRVSTKAWRRCNRFASVREAKEAPGQGLDCLWRPARGQWHGTCPGLQAGKREQVVVRLGFLHEALAPVCFNRQI